MSQCWFRELINLPTRLPRSFCRMIVFKTRIILLKHDFRHSFLCRILWRWKREIWRICGKIPRYHGDPSSKAVLYPCLSACFVLLQCVFESYATPTHLAVSGERRDRHWREESSRTTNPSRALLLHLPPAPPSISRRRGDFWPTPIASGHPFSFIYSELFSFKIILVTWDD